MRGKIFISYRRDDTRADARSIYQRLQRSFGADQLFMDVDSIPRGSDFREYLDRSLKQCRTMLVVIGRGWLDATDDRGRRRLDDPADFVRMELAMALSRKISVVPVLVDGARMPAQEDLPKDLKSLVYRQAANVRHETFASDMDALERDLAKLPEDRGIGRVSAWLAVPAVALGIAAVALWPRLVTWLAPQDAMPGVTAPAAFGVQSPKLATWQSEVRPFRFSVEESRGLGRPGRLSARLKELSKGHIELVIEPIGQTSTVDRLEAVSKGTADAAFEAPNIWWRTSPAVHLYTGIVPLGLDNRRHAQWLAERGLTELNGLIRQKLRLNLTARPCYINPPEGFWLRKPVAHVADLKGLTIRTPEFFLWRVAQKLQMKPVDLSRAEFIKALHGGAIDGGENAWSQVDYDQGLAQEGLQYYFPGFHSPSLTGFLFFNADRWNALPEATRGLIDEACRAQMEFDLQFNQQRAEAGLVRLKSKGIGVQTFPPDVMAAVERAMAEITSDLAAKDPDFKAAWASYNAYR